MKCDRNRAFSAHEIENTFFFLFCLLTSTTFDFHQQIITIADGITTRTYAILHCFIELTNH